MAITVFVILSLAILILMVAYFAMAYFFKWPPFRRSQPIITDNGNLDNEEVIDPVPSEEKNEVINGFIEKEEVSLVGDITNTNQAQRDQYPMKRFFYQPTRDDCRNACAQDGECLGYTYVSNPPKNWTRGWCYGRTAGTPLPVETPTSCCESGLKL